MEREQLDAHERPVFAEIRTDQVYDAREQLVRAANRVLLADRLDHSGPHDDAEQEYAMDGLEQAARAFVAALDAEPAGG